MNKHALLSKISESTALPVLPDVALKIIELNNEAELYPAKINSVISSDPVLAARLLQVCNSAMFRAGREVLDLGEAIAVLGVDLTMSISTGFAVVDSLRADQEKHSEFPFNAFWKKSILGAVAANELYGQLDVASRGQLFVGGLMQDIGMLVLNNIAGNKYAQLVKSVRSHFDLAEMELRVFGVDHAEVGAVLLQKWGLPDTIVSAVESSHALFSSDTSFDLTDFQYGVAFSGVIAELWIAEAVEQELLNKNIRAYLERVGEATYKNTVKSILEAIPGANEMFNMQLLSDEQMKNVA